MDKDSFDTRLGAKLKAERAILKPAGKRWRLLAALAASIVAAAGIISFRTWIGY